MDKRTKWSYCVGATGRDAAYALVSMFLMLYVQYTMKLTTAQFAVISASMVVCMVWDAVNDLLMGIIIENTHMKFGKFKPWILIGAVTNAIVIICLFTLRPTGWGFVVFYAIGYLMWGMTYTMNDISYWGLLPALSSDPKTRNTLVTVMSIFICIGQFSVAGVVPIVVAGNAVNAYRIIALVVALVFLGCQVLVTFGVKEPERADNPDKLSLKSMFKIFIRNDQLVHAGIACLLYNITNNLLIIFGVNFFYVEYGYSKSGDHVFLFTVMYGVGMLVSQALFSTISKFVTRVRLLTISIIAVVTGYAMLLGFGYVLPKNDILLYAIGLMIFFFQGLFNLVIIVMINNTIEYDEVRFNERHDSVISATRSFSVKLAGGLNQGISTALLILSGIFSITNQISDLEIQVNRGEMLTEAAQKAGDDLLATVSDSQRFILRLGMVLIPVIAITISYIIIRKKYKIDEKKYDELVATLEERKKAAKA